jgi:hypothetical protein
MKKAQKPSKVAGEKRSVRVVKKACESLFPAKLKKPYKRSSGEIGIDSKKIQSLCDFRTPISEWGIPLIKETGIKKTEHGNGVKYEQVTSAFDEALHSLCRFISQGNFEDSAKLIPLLFAAASGRIQALEAIFPEFGKLQVTDSLIKECVKEADRNRKTKKDNQTFVFDKDKYRESCENEILKAVIMHRAGWKKHWILETPFPCHEFGSEAGKNDWRAWIRIYLAGLHNQGLLRANPKTKFSKEGKAKDRSKNRADYFNSIYSKASSPSFEALINLLQNQLQLHAILKTLPDCFSFLTVIATEHPECAPKGFVPQRIKLPEIIC